MAIRTTLKVDGKEYPFFRTIRSRVMFARSEFNTQHLLEGNMDAIVYSAWCILFGACARDNVKFELTYEQFIDVCPDDIVSSMLEMDGINPDVLNEAANEAEKKTTRKKK